MNTTTIRDKIVSNLKDSITIMETFINKFEENKKQIEQVDRKQLRELYKSDPEIKKLVDKIEELSNAI